MTGKPFGGKTRPELIALAEKERTALQLRSTGMTLKAIADRLGYANESGSYKAIARALKRIPAAEVAQLRAIEGVTLDAMQAGIYERAVAGELSHIDRILSIQERRARLQGLDMPTKTEVTGKDAGPLEFTIVVPGGLGKSIRRPAATVSV